MNPEELRKILKEELTPVIETQKEHSKILQEQSSLLQEQGEMLNAVVVELHQVHKLADATLDIVGAKYESTKREIDEIKDHLNLPKNPFFGETH